MSYRTPESVGIGGYVYWGGLLSAIGLGISGVGYGLKRALARHL